MSVKAPKARHKVARGKRFARRPWAKAKNNCALKGRKDSQRPFQGADLL